MNDNYWMEIAYSEALKAAQKGEFPVGAVLVRGSELLGCAGNARSQSFDPLGHAEVLAIAGAAKKLKDWRLADTCLYVTMEPCPMCAGLILQTRIERLVYGVPSCREGCAGSVLNLLDYPGMAHHVEVIGGIYSKKISLLMKDFFKESRN
ncbi:MAG: tRNA adenosine(34) deaminase TadA [bacterium]|nr:tRNA adenosine(34) deaminase TadA [bacterium]